MDDDDNIDIEDVQQAQAHAAQDEQQQQQQQQAVVLLKKMILVLEQKETFPLQTRNKTDELVENFLENLEDDVHEMLCFRTNSTDEDGDYYRGLDSDRDTEAEVEAIGRVFPEVLTRRKEDDEDEYGPYPIQLLAFPRYEDSDSDGNLQYNVKAVSFIPVVARIAIELGLFEEEEMGGLLFDDDNGGNVLHLLMHSDNQEFYNQEHHESIDTKYLQVLIQLRRLGFLKKEDIQRYDLLHERYNQYYYFAEKRFRFFVEWDPNALTQTYDDRQLPIHSAAESSSIQGFRSVFEAGIHYYPKKKGINLLFRKSHDRYHEKKTPLEHACKEYGRDKVMEIIEDTFIRCYSSSSDDDTPPLNVMEALMTAAIEEEIHLDGVYFLLRRQPDILQKLLSSASITTAIDPNPMVVFNSNNNSISPKKKRKRKETNIGDDGGTF